VRTVRIAGSSSIMRTLIVLMGSEVQESNRPALEGWAACPTLVPFFDGTVC
jgi:hypothetical protein